MRAFHSAFLVWLLLFGASSGFQPAPRRWGPPATFGLGRKEVVGTVVGRSEEPSPASTGASISSSGLGTARDGARRLRPFGTAHGALSDVPSALLTACAVLALLVAIPSLAQADSPASVGSLSPPLSRRPGPTVGDGALVDRVKRLDAKMAETQLDGKQLRAEIAAMETKRQKERVEDNSKTVEFFLELKGEMAANEKTRKEEAAAMQQELKKEMAAMQKELKEEMAAKEKTRKEERAEDNAKTVAMQKELREEMAAKEKIRKEERAEDKTLARVNDDRTAFFSQIASVASAVSAVAAVIANKKQDK